MIRAAIVSYLIDVCLDLLESDLVVKFTPTPVEFSFRDCVVGGNYWITFTESYTRNLRKFGFLGDTSRVYFHVTGIHGTGLLNSRFIVMSGYLNDDVSCAITGNDVKWITPA
jgi:hypothetical protein